MVVQKQLPPLLRQVDSDPSLLLRPEYELLVSAPTSLPQPVFFFSSPHWAAPVQASWVTRMETAQRELLARRDAGTNAMHDKPVQEEAKPKAARVPAAENKGSRLTTGRRASLIPSARRLSYGGALLPPAAAQEQAPVPEHCPAPAFHQPPPPPIAEEEEEPPPPPPPPLPEAPLDSEISGSPLVTDARSTRSSLPSASSKAASSTPSLSTLTPVSPPKSINRRGSSRASSG